MKVPGMLLVLVGVAGSAFAGAVAVPEIDGGSAVAGIAVVAGALLILRSRRKK
jgi:LPXTG-motif cell wall-anchored protein